MDKLFAPPVSIEKFAAYLDANLGESEMHEIDLLVSSNLMMEELSDVSDMVDEETQFYLQDEFAFDDEVGAIDDNFTLPDLDDFFNNECNIEVIDNAVFNHHYHPEVMENNNLNHDSMLETIDLGSETTLGAGLSSAIYEANKQYGLEPVNIDFDPNTYQWEDDTCAIRSQEIVLRSYGIFVSQEDLIAQAEANGWYTKGEGTPMTEVGNLLDSYNVPNHRIADANIFNLIDELGHGHKVIVGVDINELYGNSFWQSIKENLIGQTPNHAMIVSGIDTSNPDKPVVTLTDPGTGKTLFECPYEKFLSAWDDSRCFMVATDVPAPLEFNADAMINFDYNRGYVAAVGKVPFEQFHSDIVSGADRYLDDLDKYIDSVEALISNDFTSQELFDDMMDKSQKLYASANEVLSSDHYDEVDEGDETKELKGKMGATVGSYNGAYEESYEEEDEADEDDF